MTTSRTDEQFIETKQYQRFQEFCDACRRYQYIGVCYGPPGVGKTLSARHYTKWDRVESYRSGMADDDNSWEQVRGSTVIFYTPPVVLTSAGRVTSDIESLRQKLRGFLQDDIRRAQQPEVDAACKAMESARDSMRLVSHMYAQPEEVTWRCDVWRQLYKDLNKRIESQPDPTALIVIDEADRLKMAGLEQLRAAFDRGGIGMVLIGMPGLEKQLTRYPQLYSRVGFVHEFKALSRVEVRQLLEERWWPVLASVPGDGIVDEESIAAIIRITGGNFRLLNRLLTQVGRVLEINKLGKVGLPVVEAARESLVIGTA